MLFGPCFLCLFRSRAFTATDPGVGDLEAGEMTSTTDALDLDSMLDGATEATTDDEALSAYDPDVHLIRKQLEGLEGMYSEVRLVAITHV